jgi:ATP-binding cassette subfamily F protein 3
MIQLSSAGKRFGPKVLFENLDWLITPRARVGLVGANGTGKTTLLKVLARLEPLDYGEVTFAKGITSSYLPQDGLTLSGRTVLAECMSVFGDQLGFAGAGRPSDSGRDGRLTSPHGNEAMVKQ